MRCNWRNWCRRWRHRRGRRWRRWRRWRRSGKRSGTRRLCWYRSWHHIRCRQGTYLSLGRKVRF
ncbi:MAG TPA: hypothetical protein EYN91_24915 [Candidatus Melainabacteria bacterium]|nr:hypothetical protein [Candidatus Melainabacteria bacterium]HIN63150.1 hypothetical protein [Candidatus Obscuribacterales bacterium]